MQLLLIFTLALHLLATNVAMAAPLLCVWLKWREQRRGDWFAGQLARVLARDAIGGLTIGLLLGALLIAILWLAEDDAYLDALQRVPANRLWFGLAEIIFYFACMASFIRLSERTPAWPRLASLLAILAAADLMFHFPPLFTIVSVAARRPELHLLVLERTTYYRMLMDPEVISRVVHIWLAAIAVSAVVMVVRSAAHVDDPLVDSHAKRLTSGAARLVLLPTLLQIPAGLWLLFQLPDGSRNSILGRDWLATAAFAASLLVALRLLHLAASISLGDVQQRRVRELVAVTVAVVLLMVAALERIERRTFARGCLARSSLISIPLENDKCRSKS